MSEFCESIVFRINEIQCRFGAYWSNIFTIKPELQQPGRTGEQLTQLPPYSISDKCLYQAMLKS
jgi:hypothetical protein